MSFIQEGSSKVSAFAQADSLSISEKEYKKLESIVNKFKKEVLKNLPKECHEFYERLLSERIEEVKNSSANQSFPDAAASFRFAAYLVKLGIKIPFKQSVFLHSSNHMAAFKYCVKNIAIESLSPAEVDVLECNFMAIYGGLKSNSTGLFNIEKLLEKAKKDLKESKKRTPTLFRKGGKYSVK